MLTELEDKRGELKQESLAFKDRRIKLNAEASRWVERRNDLNRATEELIGKEKK